MTNEFLMEDGVLMSYTGREEILIVPEHVQIIGEGAFKGCVSLKKVILPSNLRRIMPGAFKGCRRLEEVHIPSGVAYVGDYAFHRCHSLRSISLPASVKELGDCVFLYCDSLTYAGIPGVKQLGKQVFVNDNRLKRLEISPELEERCICDVFTGCSGISEISFFDGERFVFPNAVEAVAGERKVPSLVRAIAVDVLRMMELKNRCLVKFLTNLKQVEIPEGLEQIGKSAFFDKRGIISVKFPSTLKEIESRAFRNCISLESVTFQSDDVVIHEDAFKNCSSLKEVCIQDKGSYRLDGIRSVSKEGIPYLIKTLQRQVLGNFRLSGRVLLQYLGSESRVVVPDGVTWIAEEAFAGNEAVDRVILPDSVEGIGAMAFRDCPILQTIHFPPGLRYIGKGAFENCVKLLRALLPDSLEHVEDQVFKRCLRLKEAVFGRQTKTIGEQAFYGCSSLKEVSFPGSLVSVGDMAFYRCRSLEEIRLLPGIDYVGSLAFAQSGIKRVRIEGAGSRYGEALFFQCPSLRTVILEKGVRSLPHKLAYGCTALEQVILPDTLESVGRNVWEFTPFLNHWLENEDKEHGEIFWDGRNRKGEVILPKETRIVAGGAFYGNRQLLAVSIPDQVTWVGSAAFKGCTSLSRVTWPGSVTTAEPEVFSGCRNLETIALGPESWDGPAVPWQFIKERAFYNCRKLKHVSWKAIQSIGKESFCGCISLAPKRADSLRQAGEEALFGVEGTEDESGMGVLGRVLLSGKNCTGEVRVPEGITAIAPFAFSGNRQITGVVLPKTLDSIGEGAFWGCCGLTHIRFPAGSCIIGGRAFEKCTGIKEIHGCASWAGPGAFAYCQSLEKAALYGLSLLEHGLFEGCVSLRVCVCEQALVVKDNCFRGCKEMEDFDFQKIREIGSYGFGDCYGLREIALMDDTLLRPHAFEDCGRLERMVLPGRQGGLKLCEYALSGCTQLREVIYQGKLWKMDVYKDILQEQIPEMVRLVFHSALSCFYIEKEEILCGYRGLGRTIRIPEGIRRIEAEVFRDILMLEEVYIPETVEYIGPRAFHKTAWMEKQREQSPMVRVNHMLLDGSGCVGEAVVPEDVSLVCGWAFAGGTEIERIRFLSQNVRVEPYAFRNCICLKELVMADGSSTVFQGISDRKRELSSVAAQAVREMLNCFKTDENDVLVECTGNISRLLVAHGIRAIGDRVFQDGNLLTEITLPLTVTSIGGSSFAGCKWLKRVYGAKGVKTIGPRAFSGCQSLEIMELSECLSEIGPRAFENCTSLKEIFLPEGVEEIPDRAFFRCCSLERIHFPSTLKRIGKEAFAFCKNLEIPSLEKHIWTGERAFVGTAQGGDYEVS